MNNNPAFAAFTLYLSLWPKRSVVEVGRKLMRSEVLIGRWSAKFDWPTRAAAYNAHLASVEREAAEALTRVKAAAVRKVYGEPVEIEAIADGKELPDAGS